MEGPRIPREDEVTSLSRLVDTVFTPGRDGAMFRCFRQMFDLSNLSNHFVFSQEGRIVSHIGMTLRDASFCGCSIRVASIGAVATYEEYRGKGLASRLLDVTCDNAVAQGAHVMIISGDRTLYRRAGATPVGIDYTASVTRETVLPWKSSDVQVEDVTHEDVDHCAAEYAKRPVHFVRPLSDWQWLFESRTCMGRDVFWLTLYRSGAFSGYAVVSKPNEQGMGSLLEFAGNELDLAGALDSIMEHGGLATLDLRVMQSDTVLLNLLRQAGIAVKAVPTCGTLLLLQPLQLLAQLGPWFESRVGTEHAQRLKFDTKDDTIIASDGTNTCEWSKAQAAQAIFGHPDKRPLPGILGKALPAPSLWCGINYV